MRLFSTQIVDVYFGVSYQRKVQRIDRLQVLWCTFFVSGYAEWLGSFWFEYEQLWHVVDCRQAVHARCVL